MLNKNKRIRIAILMSSISVLIIVAIFLFLKFGFYSNKVVALVGNERIYENEIKDELFDMFPNSDPSAFQLEKLPHPVLKLIAKGVFVKKEIYKNAKNAMIDKDKVVQDKIDRYSRRVISEYYLTYVINKQITSRALNDKYAELAAQAQDGTRYRISAILVGSKEEAQNIIAKLKSNTSFDYLAQKYSLDKKSKNNGDLGYFSLKDIKKEFLLVDSMKNGEVSKPIKTKEGWFVVKLSDVKIVELEDFSLMKDKLIEEIKKEQINEIFFKITKDAEIKILI